MIRTLTRMVLAAAIVIYVWWAYSAVDAQTPGWPLGASLAVALVLLITVALLRRRTFGGK